MAVIASSFLAKHVVPFVLDAALAGYSAGVLRRAGYVPHAESQNLAFARFTDAGYRQNRHFTALVAANHRNVRAGHGFLKNA